MTTLDLTAEILASDKLRAIVGAIRRETIKNEFPVVEHDSPTPSIDWGFALLCASALTAEANEAAQELVLRVSVGCINSGDSDPTHKAGAASLLERLGNRRTVQLAEKRDRVPSNAWAELSAPLRLDVMRRRLELTVARSQKTDLAVNTFQAAFWNSAMANQWLSVSAPTSAGKSRIIREWFSERLRTHESFVAVYLVPTRALVEEVAEDFRRSVLPETVVVTLPWDSSTSKHKRKVFVLTQERLHLLQHREASFHVDLLFVDEAQNLGEATRGVLLQQAIDRVVSNNPEVQVLFASPLTSNPELLTQDAPTNTASYAFASETVTVSQNLVHIRSVRYKPLKREFWLIQDGSPRFIGRFTIPNRATHVPKRLAFVAHALGGESGGNIVYVNTASEAENVAKSLYESTAPYENNQHQIDIENLQELIRTAVHPKYALADYLPRGVAFHYGNMPLAIKTEVERLFHTGAIRFLVCTSTLLEGVNLPCRNIFMRNPQKGVGTAIAVADFWNLAGRAGRWGTEFQGNIVCIDTDDESLWENLPTVRRKARIRRSVDRALADPEQVIRQATLQGPPTEDDGRGESVYSYLCSRKLDGLDLDSLLSTIDDLSVRRRLEDSLANTVSEIEFPPQLVSRHAGISPRSMQRLLNYFEASGQELQDLLLPVPEDKSAKSQYALAFDILTQTVTPAFGAEKRQMQLANLVVNWMHGLPMARLIESRLAYNNQLQAPKSTAAVIRAVMSDVEKVARFQAPKYLACYLDLLAVYAQDTGDGSLEPFPDITMMLELGVSRVTEVSMMALGLSRTSTIALSQFVNDDSLTPEQSLQWLIAQNLDGLNLPVLVQREIATKVKEHVRSGARTTPDTV